MILISYTASISQVMVAQWWSCRLQIQRLLVRLPPVLFSLPSHGAPSVKLRILQNFTLYLRNSCSLNLRAIENCICGLCSIERNMRSILRTVRDSQLIGYRNKASIYRTIGYRTHYRLPSSGHYYFGVHK